MKDRKSTTKNCIYILKNQRKEMANIKQILRRIRHNREVCYDIKLTADVTREVGGRISSRKREKKKIK